jgi:hypothetical protein
MKKTWLKIALFNLLIAAILGVLLRYAFVEEVSWLHFRKILHAHSHVAMLGWIYLALFSLLTGVFLPPERLDKKYQILFWLTQLSVVGMLVTFPLVGYAPISISFSTLHTLLAYVFSFYFLKELKPQGEGPYLFSRLFAKAAIVFMLISTLALWATAPIIISGGKGSAWYYAAIQFFLHFQFNGWFLFAVLALFLRKLEMIGIFLDTKKLRLFFRLLIVSCFLTYALAVSWSTPLLSIFLTNSLGVIIQLVAAIIFIRLIWKENILEHFRFWEGVLLKTAFVCFVSKVFIQSVIVIPYIAKIGYTIRNYVIGFLHLMLLGIFTSFILAFAFENKSLRLGKLSKWGIAIFLLGFVLSEGVLFLQGTLFWGAKGFLPFYYEGLFGVSLLLPFSILLILLGQLEKVK